MVKIMGFSGYKTMEWVNEEEAAQIGKLLRLKQAKLIFIVFLI